MIILVWVFVSINMYDLNRSGFSWIQLLVLVALGVSDSAVEVKFSTKFFFQLYFSSIIFVYLLDDNNFTEHNFFEMWPLISRRDLKFHQVRVTKWGPGQKPLRYAQSRRGNLGCVLLCGSSTRCHAITKVSNDHSSRLQTRFNWWLWQGCTALGHGYNLQDRPLHSYHLKWT
jgi:hypothetical protein